MKGGLGNIMKQAQKVQEDMQRVQEEVARMEVHGEAGGGMVKVTMTGKHDVRKIEIDPTLKDEDLEMIGDLVAAAINDANQRLETQTKEKFAEVTSGLNLPPGMKLPF